MNTEIKVFICTMRGYICVNEELIPGFRTAANSFVIGLQDIDTILHHTSISLLAFFHVRTKARTMSLPLTKMINANVKMLSGSCHANIV